jgi:hypothetical protein
MCIGLLCADTTFIWRLTLPFPIAFQAVCSANLRAWVRVCTSGGCMWGHCALSNDVGKWSSILIQHIPAEAGIEGRGSVYWVFCFSSCNPDFPRLVFHSLALTTIRSLQWNDCDTEKRLWKILRNNFTLRKQLEKVLGMSRVTACGENPLIWIIPQHICIFNVLFNHFWKLHHGIIPEFLLQIQIKLACFVSIFSCELVHQIQVSHAFGRCQMWLMILGLLLNTILQSVMFTFWPGIGSKVNMMVFHWVISSL